MVDGDTGLNGTAFGVDFDRDALGGVEGGELGGVGLVIGATIGDAAREGGVDLGAVNGPLLVPGIGAQGGTPASVRDVVGESSWRNVLASTSRAVLGAGPHVAALRDAAARTTAEMA